MIVRDVWYRSAKRRSCSLCQVTIDPTDWYRLIFGGWSGHMFALHFCEACGHELVFTRHTELHPDDEWCLTS